MLNHQDQIPLPTKDEAEEIVAPLADLFRQVFKKAAEDWLTLYDKVRHILSPRSRSAVFHDHIVYHANAIFAAVPGIRAFMQKGIFAVSSKDAVDFRFKKLDSKMRANNVRTKQNTKYSMQLRLDGFEDLPRLTAGYTLDDLQLALSRMCITLQVGRRVEYVVDLNAEAGQQLQLIAFPAPAVPKMGNKPRVRPKKKAKTIEKG
jgi:hypothetical protein